MILLHSLVENHWPKMFLNCGRSRCSKMREARSLPHLNEKIKTNTNCKTNSHQCDQGNCEQNSSGRTEVGFLFPDGSEGVRNLPVQYLFGLLTSAVRPMRPGRRRGGSGMALGRCHCFEFSAPRSEPRRKRTIHERLQRVREGDPVSLTPSKTELLAK